MTENPDVEIRCDLLNEKFELGEDTTAFMQLACDHISRCAKAVCAARPKDADLDRVIAFVDKLQEAAKTICTAAIIGEERAKRAKKRKVDVSTGATQDAHELIRQFAATVDFHSESGNSALVGPVAAALAERIAKSGPVSLADFQRALEK